MDSTFFYERLSGLRRLLIDSGYDLRQAQAATVESEPTPVLVQMPGPVVGLQTIVAIPDVHLGDGSDGDIFVDGSPENARRLSATLRALGHFVRGAPDPVTLLQLGDWYDVWRAIGSDTTASRFSNIDNVRDFVDILSLDKELGLAHCIGNHDASFTRALPDRRVADGARFRFGFGLGRSNGRIYALHGHQTDRIEGEPNADPDQLAVWLGTLAARFISSEFRDLQELIDKRGADGALIWVGSKAAEAAVSELPGGLALVKGWFSKLLAEARDDVPVAPRPLQPPPNDGRAWYARFVRRESAEALTKIAVAACETLYGASVQELSLLIVGHSHKACVSWATHPRTRRPVVILDAGSWAYGQAQIAFAAGNTAAVYDVVRLGTPNVG